MHDGSGLTAVYDVTSVRHALAEQDRWDPGQLKVTFRPVAPVAPVSADDVDEPMENVRASHVVVMVA